MQSTISWVPSSINDLLLLLFKKILVYSSKIESLKKKIYQNNPNFSVKIIFKEIDREKKAYLTLHDVGYFLHYFGFKVSDWEAFKLMGYLSKYKLATLQELIEEEKINPEAFASILPKYFGGDKTDENVSQLKKEGFKFFVNFEGFSSLFKPLDKSFRPPRPGTQQVNFNSSKGVRESEFYLIRQIILLTFRKLDEMGMVVQYLNEYSSREIYEFICQFNQGMFDLGDSIKRRFNEDEDPQSREGD